MTDAGTAKAEAYLGFETLEELQAESLRLLRVWKELRRAGKTDPELAKGFLPKAAATGARLSGDHEREVAQAALDFWRTELVTLGAAAPRAQAAAELAEFDPAALPALAQESPFMGLAPYGEAHAASFFGREEAANALAVKVEAQPVTIVSGPSGSGKSSLISAGLLPALRKSGALGDAGRWDLLVVASPGSDPLAALVDAVQDGVGDAETFRQAVAALRDDPASIAGIVAASHPRPILLVVDQFEELFTLNSPAQDQQAFTQALASLGERHRLVIGIREDYVALLQKTPGLGAAASEAENRFTPPTLTAAELRRAIRTPADRAGLRFAEGVVDELVKSVAGEPAGLPLLQFTLERLWQEAKGTNWVSRDVAKRVGTPREALERSADKVFDDLRLIENQDIAKEIFLSLVVPSPGAENEFMRQPRRRAELQRGNDPVKVDLVLDRFVAAGLIRQAKGRTPADDVFDVSHEALIRNWPRLHTWLVAFRGQNREFFRLREGAILWKQSGREAGHLLSGKALEDAKQTVIKGRSDTLDEFIAASTTTEDEKLRHKWRMSRVYLPLYTMCALGFIAAFLFQRWQTAELQLEVDKIEKAKTRAERDTLATENEQLKQKAKLQNDLEVVFAALAHGDVAPLKLQLQQQGASREVLDRLTATRPVGQPTDDASEVVKDTLPRQTARSAPPVSSGPPVVASANPLGPNAPPRTAPTCQGVLWLGSKDNQKVEPFPLNETVALGARLTLKTNVRLRKDLPNPSYQMAAAIGIVPDGAMVVARGPLKPIPRTSGRQLWLPVDAPRQYCTSVFVQYSGDAIRLQEVRDALDEYGAQLPPPEQIDTAKGRAEIRYFYAADRPVVEELSRLLAPFNNGKNLKPVPLLNWPGAKPPEMTIEVWLDLSS